MENNLPSIEGKINKWKEVKAEYDKWLQTIELKYRNGKTIYTQIAEIFPAILDDLAILKMDFASQLAQRDIQIETLAEENLKSYDKLWNEKEDLKKEIDGLKDTVKIQLHNLLKLQDSIAGYKSERDHYKALAEATERLFQSCSGADLDYNGKFYAEYQSLKIQTP